MAQQEQLQKKASNTVANTQNSSEFLQSRPFATVTKSHTGSSEQGTQLNLQTKADSTSGFGHSFGNLMVSTPTRSVIQPKLTIGQPGDKYEQEADRVAAQVVQRINQPKVMSSKQEETIQRQEMPEEEGLQMKSLVQRREVTGEEEASRNLESAINCARGGGQPLDVGLQRSMGQAMGADFSRVRVHTDAQSDQLNKSIQAKAFTTGQDVFFRQGAYQPESRGGQELIAHELTHVVQQKAKNYVQREIKEEALNEKDKERLTVIEDMVKDHNETAVYKINIERLKDGCFNVPQLEKAAEIAITISKKIGGELGGKQDIVDGIWQQVKQGKDVLLYGVQEVRAAINSIENLPGEYKKKAMTNQGLGVTTGLITIDAYNTYTWRDKSQLKEGVIDENGLINVKLFYDIALTNAEKNGKALIDTDPYAYKKLVDWVNFLRENQLAELANETTDEEKKAEGFNDKRRDTIGILTRFSLRLSLEYHWKNYRKNKMFFDLGGYNLSSYLIGGEHSRRPLTVGGKPGVKKVAYTADELRQYMLTRIPVEFYNLGIRIQDPYMNRDEFEVVFRFIDNELKKAILEEKQLEQWKLERALQKEREWRMYSAAYRILKEKTIAQLSAAKHGNHLAQIAANLERMKKLSLSLRFMGKMFRI